MLEILRFIEQPRTCSYLPGETASLEFRGIPELSPAEYSDLLARGYRRFGWQMFRPACKDCVQCVSVRVLTAGFVPNAGQRRILRKNAHIRAELHPPFATAAHVELFNLYHRFMSQHRGWPRHQTNLKSYYSDFLAGGGSTGRQWLYFDGDKLIGVALMDEVPDAISLVYCYYHPDWRALSPGTFSILNQLLYAKASHLPYAYLGYWIEASQSMRYKGHFYPREILREYPAEKAEPVWVAGEAISGSAG
jgi:arginine-tRNA-protein transferase